MTAERWRRLKEILGDILERPAAEQAARLATACAGDEDLRLEADTLLAFRDRVADFLEVPAASLLGPRSAAAGKGRRVGPYRLLYQLGRGASGVVHLAVRDGDPTEKVAIKMLGDDLPIAGMARSFERERQILARLVHPGIARLLDGGITGDGRPYLVMERIEGEPVLRYAEGRGLSTEARLELFGRICPAVAFAHRNLVVHRDLKPSNILVTPAGEPKLLDFGIARLLGPCTPAISSGGARRLTVSYASPEQILGEAVTPVSDVYSLGVLLWELLTGQRRHAASSVGEILRSVCEEEPPAPSEAVAEPLRRRLRGELDRIALKALARDPHARYASVEELVADVESHRERSGLPGAAKRSGGEFAVR